MKNVVLIGMPGAGKSTVGVLLAKALSFDFIDTDLIIQKEQKKKLFEIINEQGIDEFLKIENDVLKRISAEHTVIATGGSAIFGKEAMKHLGEIGTIVYLKLSCDEIVRRVNNIKTRGIAMSKGKSLQDVYNERVSYYERYADIVIEADDHTIEETVESVLSRI